MTTIESRAGHEDATVLGRARTGDSKAFARLVEPHRRELLVHCYRTLGSFHDAEDVLQEVLLSAWRGLDGFDGRALRPWLYRIATNRCLNHVRHASRRPAASTGLADGSGPGVTSADDPWWLEPFPDALLEATEAGPEARYDARESIELAFIAGLQRLPVQQRAVLVLRDVLGLSAAEAAEVLAVTVPAVNSALVRARGGFRPERAADAVPAARSARAVAVVDRFVDALQSGDAWRVIDALGDDVRLSMPPEPVQCNGPAAVADFLRARGCWGPSIRLVEARANGHAAFGYYLLGPAGSELELSGLIVLTTTDDHVATITRFGPPALGPHFALPPVLAIADHS